MSTLIVSCIPENIVLSEAEKDNFSQEDIDSYRSCICNMNGSHQIKVTVDGAEKTFSTPSVPSMPDVTPRQIRQALFLVAGLTEANIDAALNTLPDPNKTLAMIEWKTSTAFQRHRPLVSGVAAMLGWTEKQVDDLWLYASTLP